MEQTAVEWLIEQVIELQSKGLKLSKQYDKLIINQAKEKFEQQIVDAANSENSVDINHGEQYYNETFKSE